ncbi:MAG: tRNA uracil 4-sulfurtransferase ThiI [Bryobacterales bacterium]
MQRSPILVLHYSELWLKGCNKPYFLKQLRKAVERTLDGLPLSFAVHVDGRMVIEAESEQAAQAAGERLARTPGIQYIGRGFRSDADLDSIVALGAELMRGGEYESFRVRARRSFKQLPVRSAEVERALGARILEEAREDGRNPRVDLKSAAATCWVEATPRGAFVYTDKIRGLGGLPTNTAGRLLCLLSGGIDSAVAAFKMLRRGVRVDFIHFYGAPARPGEDSPPIARDIVRTLTLYQGVSRLFLVPFDALQRQIVANAPDEFRLLLYRRMMLRIAERVARGNKCRGTITGDAVAQVASQTLRNMEAVSAVSTMPLYRPLCGDDKEEIVALARKIGTYDISTEPFTDCCPLYMPRNPRVSSRIHELDEAEAGLDISAMSEQAIATLLREVYEFRQGEVRLKSVKQYVGKTNVAEEALAG